MRLAGTILVACILAITLPGPSAIAQTNDLNCADFASRSDMQAVFDRYPGDPYGLDPDKDGIPCEASLPTKTQTVSYIGIILLVAASTVVALAIHQRRRRAAPISDPIDEKLTELETGLERMTEVIGSANFSEPEPLTPTTTASNEGQEIAAEQVRRLTVEIRNELAHSTRRTYRIVAIVALVVTTVSVLASVLVSTFIP